LQALSNVQPVGVVAEQEQALALVTLVMAGHREEQRLCVLQLSENRCSAKFPGLHELDLLA
jgi:hypothetical protein